MNKKAPNEFLFTIVALLVSIVIVHTIYVLHVRPVADARTWLLTEGWLRHGRLSVHEVPSTA